MQKILLATGVLAVTAAGACRPAHAGSRPVVLVELFTSQGCSSCPPADRLLSGLDEADAVDGVEVIPLSFHVDYWNDLGWRDPFSSADWTERQQRYGAVVSGGRVYTPQLVVQGRAHVVGSDRHGVTAAIRRAAAGAKRPPLAVTARAVLEKGRVHVSVEATGRAGAERPLEVWAALAESGLTTEVARGENQGSSLRNDFVVRRLGRAAQLGAGARRGHGEVSFAVERGWRRDHLSVVVFVQDPGDLGVMTAVRTTVE